MIKLKKLLNKYRIDLNYLKEAKEYVNNNFKNNYLYNKIMTTTLDFAKEMKPLIDQILN